jgi:hypothetical protein
MAIVPDDKDWTWVLERPCPDCGFVAEDVDRLEVAAGLRANALQWRSLLNHPAVDARPNEQQWSGLEYACHVRDVFRLYDRRLGWMLERDDPTFDNWDQDVTAVAERYAQQDPASVATEIEAAGGALADHFDRVPADGWERTGARSDGARFTIDTFARYLLHDPVHHVWDVEQGYRSLA